MLGRGQTGQTSKSLRAPTRQTPPLNQTSHHHAFPLEPHTYIPTSSFFKTLIDKEVTVELKNDIQIRGILKSVDQYLNIKLDDISVLDEMKYPHMVRFSIVQDLQKA